MRSKHPIMLASILLALGATPAFAAQPDRQEAGDVSSAVQRDLGLTAAQVNQQAGAIKLDEALRASLGEAFAGSEYDAGSGKLVVMVSDAKRLDAARAAGAQARLVRHSKDELDAIKDELDAAAGVAGGADRKPADKPEASVAGITSWSVDPTTNSVHVTVTKARAKAAARVLAKYGDAVTIERSDGAPQLTASNYMDGGDVINGNCSAGFNLRNPSSGQGYLLTAGHCVRAGDPLYGQGNVFFGKVLESWFPAYDDALVQAGNPGYWGQGPWVDKDPSNGPYAVVTGYTDAPKGTKICKSGITTRWTCGEITAKDVTVLYSGGRTVYGLTQHNACVEPGDSGGANVSLGQTLAAEGVTSGAYLYGGRCGAAVGRANESYYYPIADSLAYYGPAVRRHRLVIG